MAYSFDLIELYKRVGNNIDAILRGAKPGDIPIYLSDCGRLFELTDWRPRHDPRAILEDVLAWTQANEREVKFALGFD